MSNSTTQKICPNLCQCTHGHVFTFAERKAVGWSQFGVCPVCGSKFSVIRFTNRNDEEYVNRLAEQFSE